MSWVLVTWRFGHSRSIFCHCVCAVSSSLGTAHSCPRGFCCVARSSCFYRLRAFMLYLVLCGTQRVYSWLRAFMLSCLVWTRGLWVFSLAACHVLFCTWLWVCLLAMCLCFCFVWARGFCPSFLCATCSHVNLSWPHPSCYLNWFSPAVFPRYPHLLPL